MIVRIDDHKDKTPILIRSKSNKLIKWLMIEGTKDLNLKLSWYPPITYYWTVPLILHHSYPVGRLTSSKLETKLVSPDHLLLDSAPNLAPLISRWEINKFKNCWYKSVRILEVLKIFFQQFLNLSSFQRGMSGPISGDLSNNRWLGVRIQSRISNITRERRLYSSCTRRTRQRRLSAWSYSILLITPLNPSIC